MSDGRKDISYVFDIIRGGNVKEGVDLLYRDYYNKIYGIAFTYTKDGQTSRDIVHDLMCKLLTLDAEKFPKGNELTWIYAVTKNLCYDYLRNNPRTVEIDKEGFVPSTDRDIGDFVDMDSFYSMLKGLNDNQKEIVTLKILGGYTHKEIAEMLKKPVGTVQWLYNTAVKKLKITLSSLLSAILVSFAGIIASAAAYAGVFGGGADSDVPVGDYVVRAHSPTALIIFSVLLALSLILLVVIYKNSYKIPTKADKKSV